MYHTCTILVMPVRNELTLSRRHTTACKFAGKTPEPRNKKEEKADTCVCPIVADGYLALESKRVQHLSLSTNDWTQANIVKGELLARRRVRIPQAGLTAGQITIDHAIEKYLASRGPTSLTPLDDQTLGKYEVLLNTRLKQFCGRLGIDRIDAFEDFGITEQFVLSWVNLNPHRNQKGLDTVLKPLAGATKVSELERFRSFLEYCKKLKWLTGNQAKDIKLTYEKAKPKYGLELDEYARLLEAAEEWSARPAARRHPKERIAAIELMRWTGIRLSDVINFPVGRIQPSHSRKGYRVVIDATVKTGAAGDIPIPNHVAELILSLSIKGECGGKRYWFWTFKGDQGTATTNLKDDVTAIIKLAQKDQPFAHHCTPHSLRHTFAIQHLKTGVDIRQVSLWLTHTSIRTTEKSYAHAIRSSNIRAEQIAEESWRKQMNL
jgi:integrase/recombinase XerD